MKSRERVLNAINHEESDRIPIDNNGFVSGIHMVAYEKLLKMLNMKDEIIVLDPVQKLALMKDEVRDL